MQDESTNTIQETPNSQFRLVLSVTPCMPRTSSLESVNKSTSPILFSSTLSPTHVPTPDSPKDQLPPSPSSSTNSQLPFIYVRLAPSMIHIKPYHLNYSAPPPQVAHTQFRTSGHHPPPPPPNPSPSTIPMN